MTDLPDALDGLDNVTLYPGWETRARKSGGYDALMGIVVHHTASTASSYSDTKYMWENATTRPVGAIYLARNGEVIIGAAGATNCAGRGGPVATSKGTIALDTANSRTISIEAANAGTGEEWPKVQQETYVALVAALCHRYGFDPWRDVLAHAEWAPSRKIDPAGQSRYAAGRETWNMKLFRDDVKAKVEGEPDKPPPIKPPPEEPVTQEDIDAIARAVWEYAMTDPPTKQPSTTGKILGYARHSAANADAQTKS